MFRLRSKAHQCDTTITNSEVTCSAASDPDLNSRSEMKTLETGFQNAFGQWVSPPLVNNSGLMFVHRLEEVDRPPGGQTGPTVEVRVT